MLRSPACFGRIVASQIVKRRISPWLAILGFAFGFAGPTKLASSQDTSVDHYLNKVKPILQERCYACHGALKQEADLRLDTVAAMLNDQTRAPVIVAGIADQSDLLARIQHEDTSLRMPPEGRPLTEEEIQSITQWIQAGPVAPDNEQPEADPLSHWAFQPPQRSAELKLDGQVHPIDALLAATGERPDLEPLPRADAATLVRRVYLDLLGIPPTKSEVEAFVANDSPEAYAALIDQLLDRPEYGQRWARHWMDVWRYSDWYGRRSVPDVMNSYPQIWRWRDWIVRSLNEDKGYDDMVREMLAADELAPTDPTNIVATGFLVRNWYKWNYETWMKDNVEHTSRAFLGLSMHCAHCHDHKYDPISHEDYFRFRAFFEPLELRHDRVAGEPDPGPFQKYVYALSYGPIASGAIRVFDEKLDASTYMYTGGDARNRIPNRDPIHPQPPAAFQWSEFNIAPTALPIESAYPGLQPFVRDEETKAVAAKRIAAEKRVIESQAAIQTAEQELRQTRQATSTTTAPEGPDPILAAELKLASARMDHEVAEAAYQLAQVAVESLEARIAADDARYRAVGTPEQLAKHAHRSEKRLAYQTAIHAQQVARQQLLVAQHQLLTASTDEATAAAQQAITTAQQAYDAAVVATASAQTALVSQGTDYSPLSPSYPTTSTGRRSALANWIVDRRNPLTARVAVNHIWLRHFGQALVDTPDNFGLQGKKPIHPQLLDHLAVELMENAWSMKHLHRIIMTSAAYQRSSQVPPQHLGLTQDPENLHYWRRRPLRMEAEVVRDSVLSTAGMLDLSQGGVDIEVAKWHESPRRSLYFTIHGEADMTFLNTFDGPSVGECYRRTSTVLPQQALALTNSELVLKYGRQLAQQISSELESTGSDARNETAADEHFVYEAFWRVLSRRPSATELEVSLEFLRAQTARFAQATESELVGATAAGITPAAIVPSLRARENLTTSLFSHNDFLTIR